MPDWGYMAVRALGSITFLFVLTRILGKKQISQLTFFEYVTGIVIGDLAGFMSTDLENNYWHGVTAMLVWFIVPLAAEKLAMKSRRVRGWLEGRGTVVIQDGRVLERNLGKERYTADELLEQLRTKGVFNPADVEFAILEASGELSVLLKDERQPLTPASLGMKPGRKKPPQAVMMDGEVLEDGLEYLNLDRTWLMRELEKRQFVPGQIFLAVADQDGGLYIDVYRDQVPPRKRRRLRKNNW
ncbi:DUF421 domain-containing protein [Gorillibacterium sp. sgz5001074]|uniref:DUF421 domain-containing protein n=1 Tax=Gorillibacterium sp. sgz5001074 TaxID=3446695 RepID=UPI003F672DB2